ncbi:hypothetical protein, partial [Microseira sp. BLCC-F43]|uniref:hypothetical protein n=1 Tax=Microseira sp. BLCC-F43 TaxID=3153602 RepID=UPI0035B8053E
LRGWGESKTGGQRESEEKLPASPCLRGWGESKTGGQRESEEKLPAFSLSLRRCIFLVKL